MSQPNPDRAIPMPAGRPDPAMYAEMCVRRRLNELDKRIRLLTRYDQIEVGKLQAWKLECDMLSEWLAERR